VDEDVSERLDMIAAQMKVVQIARIKKSCRRCERMVQESAPSPANPGQHGRSEPAGPYSGLEVRRSSSFVSPARDLCPHGCGHSRDHACGLVRAGHEDPVAVDRTDPGGHHGQRPAARGRHADPGAGPVVARQGAWQRRQQGRIWAYVRDQRRPGPSIGLRQTGRRSMS